MNSEMHMTKRIAVPGTFLIIVGCLALMTHGCGQAKLAKPTPNAEVTVHDARALVGRFCVVYIRYDALGTGSDSPKPAFTDVINGAEVSIRGTLKEMNNEWVIILQDRETSQRVLWIPKNSVLSVAFDLPKSAGNTSGTEDEHGEHSHH